MGGSGWFQVDRGGWKWVIPRPGFLSEWFVRALMYVALNVGLPTVAPADSIKIHVSLSMLLRVERSARCFQCSASIPTVFGHFKLRSPTSELQYVYSTVGMRLVGIPTVISTS